MRDLGSRVGYSFGLMFMSTGCLDLPRWEPIITYIEDGLWVKVTFLALYMRSEPYGLCFIKQSSIVNANPTVDRQNTMSQPG